MNNIFSFILMFYFYRKTKPAEFLVINNGGKLMDLKLKNKVVLVTASSQGLGFATAKKFLEEGAKVMITSHNLENLRLAYKELQSITYGEQLSYVVADLTNTSDIEDLLAKTRRKFGMIDIVVNNTGGPKSASFEQLYEDDWSDAYELILRSAIQIIRLALPDLKKTQGVIINSVSASTKQPLSGLILSNTFRMAILGLSKSLANELGKYGIRVNTISPGQILTNRVQTLDEIKAEKDNTSIEKVRQQSETTIPLGRYGKPEEFANVVVLLASSVSHYVNGSNVVVDGGQVQSY